MIGIITVTHGDFGRELVRSASLVFGAVERVASLGLHEGGDFASLAGELRARVEELDDGDGVLVLVDLFGGTPSNSALAVMRDRGIACVSGLNMPVLLEALCRRRELGLEALTELCVACGASSVRDLRAVLSKERKGARHGNGPTAEGR